MALQLISTTVSDIGLVRKDNQDSTFAGVRLLAVCDGMGGHAGGDTASTIAIRSLAHVENSPLTSDKNKAIEAVSSMLSTSVIAAHDAIVGKAHREKKLSGMGTTVTAVALVAGYWVVCHIGDSRAYMLRDGEIIRITKDHSYVQHLIDTGHISNEEAKSHPQRNVVMRVLGDFDIDPRPDISIREAQDGDRWMLCSDGLSGVISDELIADTLTNHPHLQECAQTLISMAEKAGSTDNISVVIADAYDSNSVASSQELQDKISSSHNASTDMSLLGGAASNDPQPIADILNTLVAVAPQFTNQDIAESPAMKAAALAASARTQHSTSRRHADDSPSHTEYSSADTDNTSDENSEEEKKYLNNQSTQENSDTYNIHNELEHSLSETDYSNTDAILSAAAEYEERYPVQRIVQPTRDKDTHENTTRTLEPTGEIPIVLKNDGSLVDDPHDPTVATILKATKNRNTTDNKKRKKRVIIIIVTLLLTTAAAIGLWSGYAWSQSQYFVSDHNGKVAIYQGVNTDIFGIPMSHVVEDTDISIDSLPQGWQNRIKDGINTSTYDHAHDTIKDIKDQSKEATQ